MGSERQKVNALRAQINKFTREEDGGSLVELAITLPTLLLMVTGLTVFGIMVKNDNRRNASGFVGMRLLTVSRTRTTDPCATFANAVYAAAPSLKQTNLTFTLLLNGNSYTGASCNGSASSMVLGTDATATVAYPYSLNLYGVNLAPTGSVLKAQLTELMQ